MIAGGVNEIKRGQASAIELHLSSKNYKLYI